MTPYVEIARVSDRVEMRAFGTTAHELVEHASAAMFSVGRDLAAIPPTYSRPVVAPGDTVSELIARWLDELLVLGLEEGIVWSQATIDRLEPGGIQGSAAGLHRADVRRLGPVVIRIESVGPVIEVPGGFWVDVAMEIDLGLRAV